MDLQSVWHSKSWRWFNTHLGALLSMESPLSRFFAPDPDKPTDPEVPSG